MVTIEGTLKYCQQNNRVCPMPQKWQQLYNMLNNKKQKVTSGWEPSVPLLLAAWYETPPMMKILRLREHIEWAEKEGQLEKIDRFLISLQERDWYHLGE